MTMHDRDDDSDLREAFQELRREDAEQLPAFGALLADAGRRRHVGSRAVLAAAALVATVVAGALLRRPAPQPPAAEAIGHWIAPTDFLLNTPGREMLETVPHIGTRPFLTPLTSASASPFAQRSVSP